MSYFWIRLTVVFNTVVIVGFGSIGLRHARYTSQISKKLVVVDPSETIDTDLLTDFAIFARYKCVTDLPAASSTSDLVVIANWGPDHFSTLKTCVDIGFRQFVIEKPLTSKLSDLYELIKFADKHKLRIVVNQGWEAQELGLRVRELGLHLGLGEPQAIWVTGGARCLSTSGSHQIRLASSILNANPIEVVGHGKSDAINPRNKSLAYYEGVFSVLYSENKRLSMSYTNRSSVSGRVEIFWKEAIGEIISEEVLRITRRDENRSFKTVITRYGIPDRVIFEGIPPFEIDKPQGYFEALYAKLIDVESTNLPNEFALHTLSHEVLLRLLISCEIGRTVSMDENIGEELSSLDFKIS